MGTFQANKTECPAGHPYSGVNSQGRRVCAECRRASSRAWSQRNREKLVHPRKSLEERFWAKVDRRGPDDCWPWGGTITQDGYGAIARGKKIHAAHRLSYQLGGGTIPPGAVVDHRCHDPQECAGGVTCPHRSCMNPNHLRVLTNEENRRLGHTKRPQNGENQRAKTHCPQGHPYDESNTKWKAGKYGWSRSCRACARDYARRHARK